MALMGTGEIRTADRPHAEALADERDEGERR